MADKILVTQEGLQKLQEELRYLQEEKRVDIAEKLKEAISFGDLSENSEYEDARNEQAAVEKRISDLVGQLKNVEIIKADANLKGKITIGKIVTIEDLSSKEKTEYKIVGSTEADILTTPARISNESVVGKELLGKKKSDIIKVKSEAGVSEYKIIKIG